MTKSVYIECVAPQAAKRAECLELAVNMLRRGIEEREARRRVKTYYKCSRATAWRIVDMAKDIA